MQTITKGSQQEHDYAGCVGVLVDSSDPADAIGCIVFNTTYDDEALVIAASNGLRNPRIADRQYICQP